MVAPSLQILGKERPLETATEQHDKRHVHFPCSLSLMLKSNFRKDLIAWIEMRRALPRGQHVLLDHDALTFFQMG